MICAICRHSEGFHHTKGCIAFKSTDPYSGRCGCTNFVAAVPPKSIRFAVTYKMTPHFGDVFQIPEDAQLAQWDDDGGCIVEIQ